MKTIEQAKKIIEEIIEEKKTVALLIPKITETLQSFNNKVINKRIDSALKEIDKNIFFKRVYNSVVIEISMYSKLQGYHDITICHCSAQSSYGDGVAEVTTKGEMLLSDAIIKQINNWQEREQKTIGELEYFSNAKNIKKVINEYLDIKSQAREFLDSNNYIVRDLLDLKFENVYSGRNE